MNNSLKKATMETKEFMIDPSVIKTLLVCGTVVFLVIFFAFLPRKKLFDQGRFYRGILPKLPLKEFFNFFKK